MPVHILQNMQWDRNGFGSRSFSIKTKRQLRWCVVCVCLSVCVCYFKAIERSRGNANWTNRSALEHFKESQFTVEMWNCWAPKGELCSSKHFNCAWKSPQMTMPRLQFPPQSYGWIKPTKRNGADAGTNVGRIRAIHFKTKQKWGRQSTQSFLK